jgi:Spy/CpxP family protein refolding chaperone
MKKTTALSMALFATLVLAAAPMVAGEKHCPGKNKNHGMCPYQGSAASFGEIDQLNALQKGLKLTDEQVNQIFEIGTRYRALYFENRGNTEKLKQLNQEHRAEVDKVYTPAQKEELKKFHKQGMGSCPFGGKGKHGHKE